MACGLAPSAELLIVFRIVQAVGAAALIPSSLALVMHAFAHDQLPRAVAIWGAAGAVAGALGPTLGAAIVEGLGWRWAFFINLPGRHLHRGGRAPAACTSRPTRRPRSRRPSASSSSPAPPACCPTAWSAPRTSAGSAPGPSASSAPGSSCSPSSSSTSGAPRRPALDLELFRIPNFRWANLAMLVFGTAFAALFFGSILFLTDVWGWSVLQAGFGVAPGPMIVGLLAPRVGKLAGRIGQRPILIVGGVLFASSGLYRLVDARPRRRLPARLLPVDGAQRARRRLRLPAALQRRRPGPARRAGRASAAPPSRPSASSAAPSVSRSPSPSSGPRAPPSTGYDRIWWIIVGRRTRHLRARAADAHLRRRTAVTPTAGAGRNPSSRLPTDPGEPT